MVGTGSSDGLKVGAKSLAIVLGLSPSRVSQLRREGILTAEGHPLAYDLAESVQSYIEFAVADARSRAPSDADVERKKAQAEADYKEAKARQEEMRLAELEGRMHSAEDVEAATTQLVYAVRSALLAMPGRVAVDAAGRSAQEVSEIVRREACAALESLASFRYDPRAYASMVRERKGWSTDDGDAGEDEGAEAG